MSIWFFSDPHIGLTRSAHTTQSSRLRLKDALYEQARSVLGMANGPVYCLGDLFDTEANDEASILQGYTIAHACRQVLAGNHDLPNREGKLSSLQLISQMLPDNRIVLGKVDEPGFSLSYEVEACVYMVPHVATQELFERSLVEVTAYAVNTTKQTHPGKAHILCLHCNYNSGLIHNDSSLNLTKEMADALLETFDYVLLGHEHVPRTLHGGRLIILGNTHPTSFSDISDKVVWEFTGREFVSWPIWTWSEGSTNMRWDDFESRWDDLSLIPDTVQFVDVTGHEVPSDQLSWVAGSIAKLWKEKPGLLMVRNNVTTAESPIQVDVSRHRSLDLPSRISTALEGSDLQPIWQHYREAAQ